jgi:D-cysteine desulfhydrase
MNLARFARRRYADGYTPLQPMPRLSGMLDGPHLFIKRDDLLGFGGGGNKIRKLEFVVADALDKGADYLITCGAVQSNHCRLTLAAAVREGLKCGLVLEERVPGSYKPHASGNNLLYRLMGVDRVQVVPGGSEMMASMNAMADEVKAEGRRPYLIPGGASNPLGALGYAACAQEVLSQAFDQGLRIDRVVCASGSAGTHAGLLVGFIGLNSGIPVVGMNVSRSKAQQEDLVFKLARETAALAGIGAEVPRNCVLCFGDYVGPGYSLPTAGMVAAVKLLARTEAVLLDPVYTGKAMAGLIDLVRQGFFKKDENVLFVHTGGSPALYAYLDSFWEEQ